ncbi:MAG: hypothetical protein CBC71_08360 [Rhodobacteraceae bacterium TMED111]|nr:hypothetical protein [Marinovum sp.]OUV40083.1 MAG: hypothetical protein CBC71_08360 [Rhodobacteraceae bacterium TMED111]|tara:strand:+ start:3881 stop:4288 length:408 start_codon:yes stop_codon:yes gene_type:complete
MKKVKQIGLLQTKEKLNQNKTISHLADIELEVEKCLKVENELEEIAKQKSSENEKVSSYSFQANRHLVQKVMEQREIIQNRQEYLAKEKIAAAQEISRSKAKTDVLEKRKRLERAKILAENELKQEDKFNYIIKR